jgi:hypothetical protein
MSDAELERAIRQAGYDIGWEDAGGSGEKRVYALRDGKRHTRSHASLRSLAEHLGRVERPVEFIEDRDGLQAVIATHAKERNSFVVRIGACRVARFRQHKYVQLVSVAGYASAMYELRTDGLRRTSKGSLPPEVVAAFSRADG